MTDLILDLFVHPAVLFALLLMVAIGIVEAFAGREGSDG